MLRLLRALCLGLVFLSPIGSAEDADALADLAKAHSVHCAFYRHYDTDPETGDPLLVEGEGDALMYFEGIDIGRSRASAIYTRIAGQRTVTVIQTRNALHFIDNVAGMYVMTSVYSCLDYNEQGVCITYGAVNSRLFDSAVMTDPDRVYEKVRMTADLGFCDHSFIGVQEAAHRSR